MEDPAPPQPTVATLDRLEALALAATPGRREVDPCDWYPDQCDGIYFVDTNTPLVETESGTYAPKRNDADFIAACDRETILALVAIARRAIGG